MNSIFKGKGIIVGYTAALLLAAGLAFALSALPPGAGRERQEAAAAAKYKEALALMDGGSMARGGSAQGGRPHAHTISHAVLPADKPRICRQRAGRPIQRGGLHGPGGLL